MRQDSRIDRITRFLEFFKPYRGKIRMSLEFHGIDDSSREVCQNIKQFKSLPLQRLVLKKCNIQEKNTQINIFQDTIELYLIETFIKFWNGGDDAFWIKDRVKIKEVIVKKSTIVYGRTSIPVFPQATKFVCTDSYVKNPEFVWKPITENIEEFILLNNDYYGIIAFNIVYHVVYYRKKFCNLRKLEFQGQVDEDYFMQLLIQMHHYRQLSHMRFINKGAFFNLKRVMSNVDIQALKIFEKGHQVIKIDDETNRLLLTFQVKGEELRRSIDFTYQKY